MKSSILARSRLSVLIAITAVSAMFSCADENKEIDIPEPVDPVVVDPDTVKTDDFRAALEMLVPDTLVFTEGDTLRMHFTTMPWNLPLMDSVSVVFLDTADVVYPYLAVWKCDMMEDSTWIVQVLASDSIGTGDMIRMSVNVKDTVLLSKPVVLDLVRRQVPVVRSIEILSGKVSAYE